MQIAVVKPDHGTVGGYERVVDHVVGGLRGRGHGVTLVPVDGGPGDRRVCGEVIADDAWSSAPAYFGYMQMIERCAALDLATFDIVISTQPGSFAARHPRHIALFFHHHRAYYDLSDLYLDAGFTTDAELHRRCESAVRRVDRACLAEVAVVLAGSEEVAARLREYNDIEALPFHAGLGVEALTDPTPPGELVLSVSRHEFPKRTELFAAAALACDRPAVAVGSGGRLPWIRHLARRWALEGVPDELDATATWATEVAAEFQVPPEPGQEASLRFAGQVDDAELDDLYRRARCVVAPAYREDYGLTAIEGMARGRPVIVCRDGGGLTEFVEDDVTGFVVDPTPAAIAAAVGRLEDDSRVAEMGAAAREAAAAYTWDRALDEVEAAIGVTMG